MPDRRHRDLLFPLLAALAVILLLAFYVFRPFILVFAVAACVALLLAPLHKRLASALGGRQGLAAAILVLVTTAALLIPILSSLFLLTQHAVVLLDWVRTHPPLGPDELQRFWKDLPGRYPALRVWIPYLQGQISPVITGGFSEIASGANTLLRGVLGRLTHAVVDLGLFLLMLFFLLRDGGRLRAELRPISPFTESQEHQIFEHLERTIKGALQAVVVVPVAQGVLAGMGFMIFGVPSPFVWGTAVILAATVPLVGSPLGWVPACAYLWVNGSIGAALGLLVYGTVVVSGSDNVLKPLVLRGSARIHPLLGFLSIVGGVLAFGVFGFLIGPVVLSLVLSAIRIYRMDVLRVGLAGAPQAVTEMSPATVSSSSPGS